MSAQLLSSKIVVQEESPSARNIAGVATGVLAALGITERGPVGAPTLLFSYEAFTAIYGNDIGLGYAANAIRAFFDNGGQRAYFSRVVHYDRSQTPPRSTSKAASLQIKSLAGSPAAAQITGTIAGPYAIAPGDTLQINRDAAGNSTATFNAVAAHIDGGAGPYALQDGLTLILRVNGGVLQTVTFRDADFIDTAVATTAEVVVALLAGLTGVTAIAKPDGTFTITSLLKGTGSSLEITGGTAANLLGLNTGIATGTGNVRDISAVTALEVKSVVEAAVTGVTVTEYGNALRITGTVVGTSGVLQVLPASTADDEIGLDNLTHSGGTGAATPTLQIDGRYDGVYGNNISVLITDATSGVAAEFNLAVVINGIAVERFSNLTMFNGDARHIEKLINASDGGSKYIIATDLRIAPGFTNALVERPANSSGSPTTPYGPLSGGNDGLTGISEIDFVGDSATKTGFHAFDLVNDPDTLICPEVATPAIHNAALTYCSVTRNGEWFFIADPPAGLDPQGIVDYVTTTAAIKETTEFGAMYWPRVKILNPNTAIYGPAGSIVVPPSGHIAGMYARNDSKRTGGVYDPPGGVARGQLAGVIGFETDAVLEENVRDFITPALINPITRLRGQPIAVDDVLTLRSTGAFPTIAERRGVTFIERSIKDGIQWARLENNDETLREAVRRSIYSFLLQQMKYKAFRTQSPATAFYVDVGDALNPASEQFAGKLNARIGLATQKPARFVILTVSQDTRALDSELAAAG